MNDNLHHGYPDGRPLGMVVGGSLTLGMDVKMDSEASVEDVKVGSFATIQGEHLRFFGVVADISLGVTDASMKAMPPDVSNPFIARVVSGTSAFGSIRVVPMLTLPAAAGDTTEGLKPTKTVPPHFARAYTASERDIQTVFGKPDQSHFWIGNPLDMETKVCLDLQEMIKRSNGIFGKSGTGKSFLTRLLLMGILQSDLASNLVFDMHSEYGWEGSSESGHSVKGMKQLFPSKVAVFSLDEESSRRKGLSPDYIVRIGYSEIEPQDIQILRESLNLSEVAADAAYSLERHFGSKRWLQDFLDLQGSESFQELSSTLNVHVSALSALHRRLERFRRFDFIEEQGEHNSVGRILEYLQRGMHVVLEFGRYRDDLTAYILVANLLTRRIHERYVQQKESAMGDRALEPRPLVITIEEAHKFLNPEVANQTIFGNIAREMRKYNVTLLVVDQRPSGIDGEVMSQIGTKVTCLLDNERDIDAVLAGASGGRELRSVLSRLESQQQALIFGHAVPMPIVVRTREYGSPESYRELGFRETAELHAQMERDVEELFGPRER